MKIGQNIIVQVLKKERKDNPDENYFVARIEEKAVKLEAYGN